MVTIYLDLWITVVKGRGFSFVSQEYRLAMRLFYTSPPFPPLRNVMWGVERRIFRGTRGKICGDNVGLYDIGTHHFKSISILQEGGRGETFRGR